MNAQHKLIALVLAVAVVSLVRCTTKSAPVDPLALATKNAEFNLRMEKYKGHEDEDWQDLSCASVTTGQQHATCSVTVVSKYGQLTGMAKHIYSCSTEKSSYCVRSR